jgi:hypothetical protein
VVEDATHEAAIPEEGLRDEVVDAKGLPKLDVFYSLIEREIGREERDENIAARPVFDIYGTQRA